VIDQIAAVIDDVSDPAARPRLRKCLPFLSEAVEHIDARVARGRLVIAAASKHGAIVVAADGWPRTTKSKLTKGDVALALGAAIDSRDASDILTGLTIILGRAGLEAHELDAAQIVEDGGQPLVVALVEREKTSVTLLITTVSLPAAATVH
jgi:hypothetical protein